MLSKGRYIVQVYKIENQIQIQKGFYFSISNP